MGSTVPSPENPMENARMLMGRKDRIQEELDAQLSVLKSQSCTMSTPLVDAQGFPRADIDVYAVRQARVRIIELRNDLVDVTDKIKLALEVLHSEPQPESVPNQIQTQTPSSSVESDQDDAQLKPFARVDGVMPGSPSADAGLRREDLLLRFGHLKASSFSGTSLQPLAEFVSQQENRQLTVKVRRGGEDIALNFTPRQGWGGRGMLGCHIVPYTS
ncbi:hypothetical protein SCHPADRAFT_915414 [Schizopora paradoxa]|uniref:Probable 26S proteasome regulatory subunit p27 n=1 Tax=Schizopora paradoxa TaxID=27342 RepID=A0A0H2RM26_9AGAM|nr:hypothetical protein SCHPADRAFT_915414 [Schizopora paradoxa]